MALNGHTVTCIGTIISWIMSGSRTLLVRTSLSLFFAHVSLSLFLAHRFAHFRSSAGALALVVVGIGVCCCGFKRRQIVRRRRSGTPKDDEENDLERFSLPDISVDQCVLIIVAVAVVVAIAASNDDSPGSRGWTITCAVASAVSWLPLPSIIREFKRSLAQLEPMNLSEQNTHLGPFGVCMFVWGLLDFVRGPLLCVTVGVCGQWVLLSCSIATLAVTTATTGYLALTVLDEVKKTPAAADWIADNGKLVAFVGIAASSRLDMIAVLKLKLCGKLCCDMPMEDKHFHFCRHAGIYHYLIEDMPHALVGIASWQLHCGDEAQFGVDAGWFAVGSAGLSACSILFGLVNKGVQMRIASGRSDGGVPLLSPMNADGFRASEARVVEKALAAHRAGKVAEPGQVAPASEPEPKKKKQKHCDEDEEEAKPPKKKKMTKKEEAKKWSKKK